MNDNVDKIILNKRLKVLEILKDTEGLFDLESKFTYRETDLILFDEFTKGRKTLAFPIEVLSKIDFNDIDFDEVDVRGIDFSKLTNVVLNVQRIYDKSLEGAILNGVTLTGEFNNVKVNNVDFTNSFGNKRINPQLVFNKDLSNTNLSDKVLTTYLDGCNIENANLDNITFDIKEEKQKVKKFRLFR